VGKRKIGKNRYPMSEEREKPKSILPFKAMFMSPFKSNDRYMY